LGFRDFAPRQRSKNAKAKAISVIHAPIPISRFSELPVDID
jgi:hypothetical protein